MSIGGWQMMAGGDCRLAVGSWVGNGGIPSARDARIRGSPNPFWVFWGHFRAIRASAVAATQTGVRAEMGQTGQNRLETGRPMPEMAQTGPTLPKLRGPLSEISILGGILTESWPTWATFFRGHRPAHLTPFASFFCRRFHNVSAITAHGSCSRPYKQKRNSSASPRPRHALDTC